jgi:hypothetical protein
MNEKETRTQIEAVYKELAVKDPNFTKYKCPVCNGYGEAQGAFVNSTVRPNHIGTCFYCGGSGVARSRKRHK